MVNYIETPAENSREKKIRRMLAIAEMLASEPYLHNVIIRFSLIKLVNI